MFQTKAMEKNEQLNAMHTFQNFCIQQSPWLLSHPETWNVSSII
jgi:hypothetical protein